MPLLAIICHRVATTNKRAHLRTMVDEIGSILVFGDRLRPNNAGTQLVFMQYRPNDSWGVYLQAVSNGRRTLLYELPIRANLNFDLYEDIKTLGWSPDDKYFAYCRNRRKVVVICDGDSGNTLAEFRMDNSVTAGVWLSSQTLLGSDGIQVYEFQQSGKRWMGPQIFLSAASTRKTGVPKVHPIELLEAFSTNTVLWRQHGTVWSGSKGVESPVKIWQAPDNAEMEFSYSQKAQKFLVHSRDKDGDFFADFYPRTPERDNILPNVVTTAAEKYHPTQISLIAEGTGYAYLDRNDFSLGTLIGRDDSRQMISILVLALSFMACRFGLPYVGVTGGLKGYLGGVGDAFGVSCNTAEAFLTVMSLYLLMGGLASLLLLWIQNSSESQQTVKTGLL